MEYQELETPPNHRAAISDIVLKIKNVVEGVYLFYAIASSISLLAAVLVDNYNGIPENCQKLYTWMCVETGVMLVVVMNELAVFFFRDREDCLTKLLLMFRKFVNSLLVVCVIIGSYWTLSNFACVWCL
eukprot:TRINITY_DN4310_c0_g1_i4.p1 TRINITY_DN4310_c0_g1~~TRINITY_DN4310_c0_g1_i4.p1  ORF type:complete len:129 (+),score=21.17 TRINITY_DN4310_c0_g1_i4:11-397(+)